MRPPRGVNFRKPMATDAQIAIRKITSVNPATGEILREFEPATEAEVNSAVARAHAAQSAWCGLGVQQRISILNDFRRLLHDRKSEIARSITIESGKPQVEALLTEVLVVLDAARFYAENSYAFLRDQTVPHANLAMKTKSGRLVREPYGVIGIISPWNYPFSIPATETLAALVSGNAVVLKPSEFTSLIALELAALLWKAGMPKDICQVLLGDGNTGSALVNSNIDKLVFTGSVTTGKRIAEVACRAAAAGSTGIRRQGSHAGARRCRRRRGLKRRCLGRIRKCGSGLLVGRALLRSSKLVSTISRSLRPQGGAVAGWQWNGHRKSMSAP